MINLNPAVSTKSIDCSDYNSTGLKYISSQRDIHFTANENILRWVYTGVVSVPQRNPANDQNSARPSLFGNYANRIGF